MTIFLQIGYFYLKHHEWQRLESKSLAWVGCLLDTTMSFLAKWVGDSRQCHALSFFHYRRKGVGFDDDFKLFISNYSCYKGWTSICFRVRNVRSASVGKHLLSVSMLQMNARTYVRTHARAKIVILLWKAHKITFVENSSGHTKKTVPALLLKRREQ